jgi:hypothetical protein
MHIVTVQCIFEVHISHPNEKKIFTYLPNLKMLGHVRGNINIFNGARLIIRLIKITFIIVLFISNVRITEHIDIAIILLSVEDLRMQIKIHVNKCICIVYICFVFIKEYDSLFHICQQLQ